MNSLVRHVVLLAGLVLLLTITPSWGQPVCVAPGCNPTVSDANNNTAGGTGALSPNAVLSEPTTLKSAFVPPAVLKFPPLTVGLQPGATQTG